SGGLQLSTPEVAVTRHTRNGLVFVVDSTKAKKVTYRPRVVMLGVGNFDYTEVVSGLQEGEKVALLTSLQLQAQRQQHNDRLRQGRGGVPGLNTGGPGAGGPGGPGGRPGGGGGGGGGGAGGGGRPGGGR